MGEPAAPASTSGRRRYDSPKRRAQSAATRERILAAGAEILHGSPVWNWQGLSVRAVAERAGVSERTVYRHFENERGLRDAVFARLAEEAHVDLDGLTLDTVRETTARILSYVSSFPLESRAPDDPTLLEAARRQRTALLDALTPATDGWSVGERATVAALLDVLWSVSTYERLVAAWGIEPEDAIEGITWAIGLLEAAVDDDRRPGR